MATLDELVDDDQLVRFEPDLKPREQEHRRIYFTMDCFDWIDGTLPYAIPDRGKGLIPLEQLEAQMTDFAVGRRMSPRKHLKKLKPLGNGVWEIRCTDVRLIGFFPIKGTFLATGGDLKKNLKRWKDYRPYISQCLEAVASLPLDEPKQMMEDNLNALL